jgi:hypothetical protein
MSKMNHFNKYKRLVKRQFKDTNQCNKILDYLEIFLQQRQGTTRVDIVEYLLRSANHAYILTKRLRKKYPRLAYPTVRFHLQILLENNLISTQQTYPNSYRLEYHISKDFNMDVFNIIRKIIKES